MIESLFPLRLKLNASLALRFKYIRFRQQIGNDDFNAVGFVINCPSLDYAA